MSYKISPKPVEIRIAIPSGPGFNNEIFYINVMAHIATNEAEKRFIFLFDSAQASKLKSFANSKQVGFMFSSVIHDQNLYLELKKGITRKLFCALNLRNERIEIVKKQEITLII